MGELILWVLVVAALSTFIVETAFIYVSQAKKLLDGGVDVPLDIKLIAYFWLAVGYPADVLFNWTRGTIMFRELPKEFLFTERVQRHVSVLGTHHQQRKAIGWAQILNRIDPGHVRFV